MILELSESDKFFKYCALKKSDLIVILEEIIKGY